MRLAGQEPGVRARPDVVADAGKRGDVAASASRRHLRCAATGEAPEPRPGVVEPKNPEVGDMPDEMPGRRGPSPSRVSRALVGDGGMATRQASSATAQWRGVMVLVVAHCGTFLVRPRRA